MNRQTNSNWSAFSWADYVVSCIAGLLLLLLLFSHLYARRVVAEGYADNGVHADMLPWLSEYVLNGTVPFTVLGLAFLALLAAAFLRVSTRMRAILLWASVAASTAGLLTTFWGWFLPLMHMDRLVG